MIIWTQQPFKVYRKIITDGFYYCNPKLIPILQEDENFKRAYSWMIKEMHRRIGYPRQQIAIPSGDGIEAMILNISVQILGGQ